MKINFEEHGRQSSATLFGKPQYRYRPDKAVTLSGWIVATKDVNIPNITNMRQVTIIVEQDNGKSVTIRDAVYDGNAIYTSGMLKISFTGIADD
jgi:hypothetical protein